MLLRIKQAATLQTPQRQLKKIIRSINLIQILGWPILEPVSWFQGFLVLSAGFKREFPGMRLTRFEKNMGLTKGLSQKHNIHSVGEIRVQKRKSQHEFCYKPQANIITGFGVRMMVEGVLHRDLLLNLDSFQTLLSAMFEPSDMLLPWTGCIQRLGRRGDCCRKYPLYLQLNGVGIGRNGPRH